jgi:hypothetical protein
MDIVAHTLWVGAGVVLARRRWPMAPRNVALTPVMAACPTSRTCCPSSAGGCSAAAAFPRCAR